MQQQIKKIDLEQPCGWIVDLRGNYGGELWSMLIGIGPILGEGKAGDFIDAYGDKIEWAYQDGKMVEGGQTVAAVLGPPYHLARPDPPVAVLFDGTTYSAGEFIAISFVGRPNTRSFGRDSGGLTTALDRYILSDGATIVLADVVDADRTGKVYGGAIIPDVQVTNDSAGIIPDEALLWLASQPACR